MNRFISSHRSIRKKMLYIPAITIVALSLTLTFIVAISLYRNIHREHLYMRETLENEGIAIINVFSELMRSKMVFQELVQGVARTEKIAYIAFLNSQGEVIAQSGLNKNGVDKLGFQFQLPQSGKTLTRLKENEHIFELITELNRKPLASVSEANRKAKPSVNEVNIDALPTPQVSTRFILLGLKTTEFEQVHAKDIKHTILMAVMLLVIGSASLYFIMVVQNYYLVDRTLGQMKTYIHHIVSSMPNGLISLDESGYITTFNRAAVEMLSLSLSTVKGEHFSNIFKTNAKEIESVLKSGEAIIERETRYTQQSPSSSGQAGEIIPLSLSATQLLDDTGKPLGAVILLRDLREVKELQAKAQRAEHLASIGHLASTIAHEIRNPLSSIRGFTQYFAAQFRDGTDEQKYATVMMNEIDHLNRIIEELLDYSRPITLKLQETSIENIFNRTIQLIKSDAAEQGIRIVREFSANIPPLRVDSERIIQALLNVCLNAIAAMEDGGTLTITARQPTHASPPCSPPYTGGIVGGGKQGDTVEIVIADTGVGIAEADLPKVFDPFFTTKSSGTGLGLAIVRKIVDYHEGSIDIKSQLGAGTTVIISLPWIDD